MSIDRLRYFAAVVETKSLRKAGDIVGISAPSMSKAISVLETELGHSLIHPDGRGIGITSKGLEVYRLSVPLLEEYLRFHQRIESGTEIKPRIRVGTFEVFSSYFMSAFLDQERDNEFTVLEMTPGNIEQALLDGIIDVGLTYLPSPDPALEYKEIGSFRMGIFGHKKWLDVPFLDWPFAVPVTELKIRSSEIDSLDMWPRSAQKRTLKYHFELLETALQTTRRGFSVIHCPDFIVQLQNEYMKSGFHLVPLPAPPGYKPLRSVKTYLVGRKGSTPEKLEGKFAKFMRTLRSEGR